MKNSATLPPKDSLLFKALPALQRAARQACETAIQTGTAVIVMRDGQLQRLNPNEINETKADYLITFFSVMEIAC